MPIPSECQSIADEIEQLKAEKRGLQGDLPGLTGQQKWFTLQSIGALNTQITKRAGDLNSCILGHAPGYETAVVIFDLEPTPSVTLRTSTFGSYHRAGNPNEWYRGLSQARGLLS